MINYRSLKKLLGETSLERKCRLLLGSALMILITVSFWFYAARTRQLVENQQIVKAEALIPGILRHHHQKKFSESQRGPFQPTIDGKPISPDSTDAAEADLKPDWAVFAEQLGAAEEFRLGAKWSIVLAEDLPSDDAEVETLERFKKDNKLVSYHTFAKDAQGDRHVTFYKALKATQNCLKCHNGQDAAKYGENNFVAMVWVSLPMAAVEGKLNQNRAILIASAIVTSFLAMLVAYVIVRYIIVKPVLHLKDVSDEIARGNLNLRADISTGDEFEELSHAFNRMLRHMTTVNDELRGVNDNLDGKVDQLAQANMELFNTNAMKDEFLATMSHELRTPLNSILGFSDVLAGAANLDDRQKRYVENIRKSGRNLMVQINDLLDLAKIESGQMKIQISDVNVKELLETQVGLVAPLADQKNIDVRIQHSDTPLEKVVQDVGKLRQILTNLLSNAIKFTPEGGRVRVSSRLFEDEGFEICVEDTGIGIPMHEQDEIFEKFRQGTTTSGERDQMKREFGGTGLGLSIVRELSRLLGGDVYLESEFGKGSIFMVRLPFEPPPEREEIDLSIESPSSVSLNRITSVDLLNSQIDAQKEDKTPDDSATTQPQVNSPS